jgi:hypothetical protein
MAVAEMLEHTVTNVVNVINRAVDEILQTASVSDSAFGSIAHFFAWIFIGISFVVVFKHLQRFLLKQAMAIARDLLSVRKSWRRREEVFPNNVFDPFENLALSRTRISQNLLTKVWGFLGTDRELMAGLRQKHWAARLVLAISIVATTSMAIYGSASFVRELSVSSGAGTFQTAFAMIFGAAVYTSIIYAFDLSIVTAARLTLVRTIARICFAVFMAFIIGVQLNIDFHKDYLMSRLRKSMDISGMEDKLASLKQTRGQAEIDSTSSSAALTTFNARLKGLQSDGSDMARALQADLGRLKEDEKTLTCIMLSEQLHGRISGCGDYSRFNLQLNTSVNRGNGPASPDCAGRHARTNYCVISREAQTTRDKIAEVSKNIMAMSNGVARAAAMKEAENDLQNTQAKLKNSAGGLEAIKGKIAAAEEDLKKAKERLSGSKTDLLREMMKAMKEDISGNGDGSSYWIIAMFLATMLIDLFAVIAKFITESSLYDKRLRSFEAIEAEQTATVGKLFTSVVINENRTVTDILRTRPANEDRTDGARSDEAPPHEASFVKRLLDDVVKRVRQ